MTGCRGCNYLWPLMDKESQDWLKAFHYFDATSDGQHFFFIKSLSQTGGPTQINTVLNWSSDLRKMMASRENP